MQSNLTFYTFCTSHIIVLIFSLLMIIFFPLMVKKYANLAMQQLIGKAIGWTIIISWVLSIMLELAAGTFDIKLNLPLHLCNFTNLLILTVLHYRSFRWFEVMYFWVFAGTLQATLTPDLQHDFPHFYFFRYFIGHAGLILAIIYAVVVFEMKPNMHSVWKAFLATNVYMAFVSVINYAIDANYFYTCAKPRQATLLDALGEWPWYIIKGEVVTFLLYIILFLPFAFQRKQKIST